MGTLCLSLCSFAALSTPALASPCEDFTVKPNMPGRGTWDGHDPRPGPNGTLICTDRVLDVVVREVPVPCGDEVMIGKQTARHMTLHFFGELVGDAFEPSGLVHIRGETGTVVWSIKDGDPSNTVTEHYGLNWIWDVSESEGPRFVVNGLFAHSGETGQLAVGNVEFTNFFDWETDRGQWPSSFLELFFDVILARDGLVCDALLDGM